MMVKAGIIPAASRLIGWRTAGSVMMISHSVVANHIQANHPEPSILSIQPTYICIYQKAMCVHKHFVCLPLEGICVCMRDCSYRQLQAGLQIAESN